MHPLKPDIKGFTLIELMIVIAIIGILAAIAVPNFMSYRSKALVAQGVATSESLRGALAGYAAVSPGNTFPMTADIGTSWDKLRDFCNVHGSTLYANPLAQGIESIDYHGMNSDMVPDTCDNNVVANECVDYYIVILLSGVPRHYFGSQIEVRTSSIIRQSY